MYSERNTLARVVRHRLSEEVLFRQRLMLRRSHLASSGRKVPGIVHRKYSALR
jgi:hypothetical protein